MSRYRRSNVAGATYFFNVATYQRKPVLIRADVRVAMRDAIEQVREKLPFTIDASVLLSDHLHAIWTLPPGDAAFGKRWGMIKAHVSRSCAYLIEHTSRVARHESNAGKSIFGNDVFGNIKFAMKLFQRCVDYIHYNPVKHNLLKSAKDRPYSTFHRFVRRGVYSENWGGDPDAAITIAGE